MKNFINYTVYAWLYHMVTIQGKKYRMSSKSMKYFMLTVLHHLKQSKSCW